jgi:transcriptional regulator with XRE-family HTH domain
MKKEQLQQKIGERIKEIRESKKVSQQALADMCNFEKGNMSRIESGRTNPTIGTIYKISQSLDVKIVDILDVE